MTEEKIIDGVNVAGCCYYESKNDTGEWCDLTCTRDNAPGFRCEKMPNCYYKQLKRLELEHNTICYNLGLLEQENKELKGQLLEDKILDEHIESLSQEDIYRSALEEIKSILKEVCKEECDYTKSKFCGDCDCRYGQILTKINEVLNEL